ncbi:MAG: PilZ domain-containing protein [Sedimentisphaerales bacterium]|nr:PilZ domain-containing protein [Sedimentisphaerales bacterium]
MDRDERRKYKRFGAKYDISFREVGSTTERTHTGCTVNVGTGGLYFESKDASFKPGSLLEVELSIPPKQGLLEFGGRISGFARVLRTDRVSAEGTALASGKYGVALQFCRSPRLCL